MQFPKKKFYEETILQLLLCQRTIKYIKVSILCFSYWICNPQQFKRLTLAHLLSQNWKPLKKSNVCPSQSHGSRDTTPNKGAPLARKILQVISLEVSPDSGQVRSAHFKIGKKRWVSQVTTLLGNITYPQLWKGTCSLPSYLWRGIYLLVPWKILKGVYFQVVIEKSVVLQENGPMVGLFIGTSLFFFRYWVDDSLPLIQHFCWGSGAGAKVIKEPGTGSRVMVLKRDQPKTGH